MNVWGKSQKSITFSVPIKKKLDNGKTITYKINFIDSFRFISSSFLNLADNLYQGLHSDRCMYYKSCFDYMVFKNDQSIFSCFECRIIIKT